MKIDLHIHSKSCSDGKLTIEEIFAEAKRRGIGLLSITDHDSVDCQGRAMAEAERAGIEYISGVELNVTYSHPNLTGGRALSLDFLGYNYDITESALTTKLQELAGYREERARSILDRINAVFESEGIEKLTADDMKAIAETVDGSFGRPHIANYLVKKGIVADKQEAFDRYLVRCDVPKFPLSIDEASNLIRNAGGIIVLAHPDDPNGTSLAKLTRSLGAQLEFIEKSFLKQIDGVECWHSRHSKQAIEHYIKFARMHKIVMTGGSDCHQSPILMGTVDVPDSVAASVRDLRRGR